MPRSKSSSADTNALVAALVAALLRDLAQAHKSVRAGWGFKRAANAVRDLDAPLESLVKPDGSLAKIKNVGPKSEQVIREALVSAPSYVFFASNADSSYITGEVLTLLGGNTTPG